MISFGLLNTIRISETFYIFTRLNLLIYALLSKNNNIKVYVYGRIQILIITRLLIDNNVYYTYTGRYINDQLTNSIIIRLLVVSRVFLLQISSLITLDLRYTYEYIILIMTSVLGMIFLIKANDLIGMYLAIELQSMGLYILAAYSRTRYSSEGGLKYYVMGGLGSCIQLLGIAMIYGLVGTTNYIELSYFTDINDLKLGYILILSGLVFKLGGVPFHMWLPDVYQGSPLISTAFFSILPKLSLIIAIYQLSVIETHYYEFIRIASILIGTIQALYQVNIKRLFAYSAISHIGFIFIGITMNLWNSVIYYIMIYIIMSIRLFTILMEFKINNRFYYNLNSLQLLGIKQPVLRFLLRLILFSMAGIPPLAGFFSKFYLLERAIYQNYIVLRLIAIFGSIIATVYYIQIVQLLYFYNNQMINNNVYVQNKLSYSSSIVLRFSSFILINFIFLQQNLYIFIGQFI